MLTHNSLHAKSWLVALLTFTVGAAGAALAASSSQHLNPERRIYQVLVDEKPAGRYELDVSDKDNAVEVIADCQVSTKIFIFTFGYHYHGREMWKGNQLLLLHSTCVGMHKNITLNAKPQDDKILYTCNGKKRTINGDTLTSSFWFLPNTTADKFKEQYIEVDTGRIFGADLQRLGVETFKLGNDNVQWTHYRVSGGDEDDLWYDKDHRLARQTCVDLGHRTTVQLTSIEH